MTIPAHTIERMERMQDDQMSVVLKLVDFYTKSPVEIFDDICEEESRRPVSEEQVEAVVSEVRRDRYERTAGHAHR